MRGPFPLCFYFSDLAEIPCQLYFFWIVGFEWYRGLTGTRAVTTMFPRNLSGNGLGLQKVLDSLFHFLANRTDLFDGESFGIA